MDESLQEWKQSPVISDDGICTAEIKRIIAMAKNEFNKRRDKQGIQQKIKEECY